MRGWGVGAGVFGGAAAGWATCRLALSGARRDLPAARPALQFRRAGCAANAVLGGCGMWSTVRGERRVAALVVRGGGVWRTGAAGEVCGGVAVAVGGVVCAPIAERVAAPSR